MKHKTIYIIITVLIMMTIGCAGNDITGNINAVESSVASKNTYTVTFNANGGSGRMAAQSFRGGQYQSLSKCTFTRGGYSFAGWSDSAGGRVKYNDRDMIAITKNIALYAVWR